MTTKQTTTSASLKSLLQLNAIVRRADDLFAQAARAWEGGNNSGTNDKLEAGNKKCDELRAEAEAMLKPFGIEVDYPGLYPSFTVRGYGYHTTESAISAATEDLIAAAPELLACCESEMALYEGMQAHEFAPETEARLNAMRAAIAKAKGA